MKKKLFFVFFLVLVFVFGSMVYADGIVQVSQIFIDEIETEHESGEVIDLSVFISPSTATNKKVEITSSDPLVASCSGFTLYTNMPGKTTLTAKSLDGGAEYSFDITVKGSGELHILDCDYIYQKEDYPNACEIVSTVMALRYLNIDVSVENFAKYVPTATYHSYANGLTYGADPEYYFSGSVTSNKACGCFVPCITSALASYKSQTGAEITYSVAPNSDFSEFEKVIDEGYPVIVWVTEDMQPSYLEGAWYKLVKSGGSWNMTNEIIYWTGPEHCMLLVGYDDEYYYFNDSLSSKAAAYKKEACQTAYDALNHRAIIIRNK